MSKKTVFIVSILLIIIGISGRLLPHFPNVTPIAAIALFSTAYLSLRHSFFVFLLTMIITDLFLGFYEWQIMSAVYACFLFSGILGLGIRKRYSIPMIFLSTLFSSIVFFLVTNFAVWQFGSMYPHSLSGLMESYALALPFFKNSLGGDLIYAGLFFGVAHAWRLWAVRRNVSLKLHSFWTVK